jgi:hypothetical protein
VTDRLAQLAVRVLSARRARTNAGSLRLSVSPEDEGACEDADTKADDARSALEAAYREHFDEWLKREIETETQARASARGNVGGW